MKTNEPPHKKEPVSICVDKLNVKLRPSGDSFAVEENEGLFNLDGTIRTDLFSISKYDAPDIIKEGGFTLQKMPHKMPQHYNLHYELSYDGQIFGTIYLDKRKGFGGNNIISLQVVNWRLYEDFVIIYKKLLATFKLELNNITNLDIAIDTNVNLIEKFMAYYLDKDSYHFSSSKKTITAEMDRCEKKSWILIGKDKSKQVSIYDKTKEIKENSHKGYITSMHLSKGLDVSKPVYRFELRLRLKAFSRNNNHTPKAGPDTVMKTLTRQVIDCEQLMDSTYLLSILKMNLKQVFDFRVRTNTRFTNCPNVDFLDFVPSDLQFGGSEVVVKTNTYVTDRQRLLKRQVMSLHRDFVTTENSFYMHAIKALLEMDLTLKGWYEAEYRAIIIVPSHTTVNLGQNKGGESEMAWPWEK